MTCSRLWCSLEVDETFVSVYEVVARGQGLGHVLNDAHLSGCGRRSLDWAEERSHGLRKLLLYLFLSFSLLVSLMRLLRRQLHKLLKAGLPLSHLHLSR